MTASWPDTKTFRDLLPGAHRVRARRAGGGAAEYWYAWRGGPQILAVSAASDALLQPAIAKAMPEALAAFAQARQPQAGDTRFVYGLITRYLAEMAEDESLAPRTKADRRKFLEAARARWGELEIRGLESRHARTMLIDWRDSYKATPKTADELLGAFSTVLTWAARRGELSRNPVEDFPRIYKTNRAEVIWEPQHLATLLAHVEPAFEHAIRLAALTGLREGDLIELPWSAVGQNAIVWQTNKSRGRKTIVLPLTTPLRQLLGEIPKRATTVLASSRDRPWKASGLAAALRRGRIAALAHARKIHGPDAKSGIEHLRIHDLRGTAATNFIAAGLDLTDVAQILGWKLDRVREIAARYVTAEVIGLAMVKRLGKNAPKANGRNSA